MDKIMNGRKTVLWVVGDSTLSEFKDNYYYPRYGYGTMLKEFLDDDIEVRNLALSGRSSKSYIKEPNYKILLEGMQSGDFLIIGFGHNDEKTEAGRYTDSNGDYKTEQSFAYSLYTNYIEPAKKTGCQPILCTPIVRRTETGIWEKEYLHITKDVEGFPGGDYPEAERRLGRELLIPVIDMTMKTKELYEKLGVEKTQYLHAWTSQSAKSVDDTHTNIWGARVNACLLMRQLSAMSVKGLSNHIVLGKYSIDKMDNREWKEDYNNLPEIEQYLVSNSKYKPVVFNRDLKESKYWPEINGFKGTVFGDIGNDPLQKNFILEEGENKSIHIAIKNNCGKIAGRSDGLAMYYKRIPVNKNFKLSVRMKINSYMLNDQVSFGLMVRDDCYTDITAPDLLGDYVAAAPLCLTRGKDAWNCFARKSGELIYGGICKHEYKEGDEVEISIEGTSDGYACSFGDEDVITGGFDFKLTAIDDEYVYAGMFATRNADVTFSDIQLIMK